MPQVRLLRNKNPRNPESSAAATLGFAAFLAGAHLLPVAATADIPAGYTGKPYKDSILEIPGRIRLFRFDEGPKNMVWWDVEGSNKWYCKVREPAAVGLQLMGAGGDKWEPGKAEPGMSLVKDECYLAQTNTGDWTKYTVRVKQKGAYSLSFLEAANATNIPFIGVSFLAGKDSVGTGQVTLPLTSYFHNWVYAKNLATVALDTGLQVMRFDILGNGPMNINYIDFAPASGTSVIPVPGSGGTRLHRAVRLPDGRLRLAVEAPAAGVLTVAAFRLDGSLAWSRKAPVAAEGRQTLTLEPVAEAGGVAFLKVRQGGAWSAARALAPGN